MKFTIPTAVAVLASVATAQCPAPTGAVANAVAALNTLGSDAAATDSLVKNFQASSGLLAALNIQTSESKLETDLSSAVTAVNGLSTLSSCDVESIVYALGSATPAIVSVIEDLAAKESAFAAVNVNSIIQGDLNSLISKTYQVESGAYALNDCALVQGLAPYISEINAAFAYTANIYGVSAGTVPVPPAC